MKKRGTHDAAAGATRERILDAAVKLLEREGPRAFQQVRVAREAGMEQGHITYYFPHKADLEAAVVEHIVQRQQAAAVAFVAADANGDPRARAIEFIKRRVTDRGATRLLLAFMLHVDDTPKSAAARERVAQMQRAAFAAVFGRAVDDPRTEAAFGAIRGLALGQLLAPIPRKQIDAAVEALVQWMFSD